MTRVLAAVSVAAMAAVLSLLSQPVAQADPTTCPPNCDRIPAAAWVDPVAIPLSPKYSWPDLADIAVPQQRPRFYFEDLCASPPALNDPRAFAVASKATVANPPGQWQLQVQVLHWRGEAWYGGQLADDVVGSATTALRACQVTAPRASPSLTTDEPGRLAAVLSVAGTAPSVVHQYLVSHPQSGSVVELAMWATSPPAESWPVIPDAQVLDALVAPLCVAYIASCR
ncbi:ATPase [Mycobacterium sp.]|uniref:ATPase n=1 Tax=Mycobacterium sp. TaxID=1785 RepID=UPI003C741488